MLDSGLLSLITCVLCTPGMGTVALSDELLGISDILFVVLLWPWPPSCPSSSRSFYFLQHVHAWSCLEMQLWCHLPVKHSLVSSRINHSLCCVHWSMLLGLYTRGCFSIYQPLCCSDLFTHPSPGRDCVFLKGSDKDEYAFVFPAHRICNWSQCIFVEWIINTRQAGTSCSWASNS